MRKLFTSLAALALTLCGSQVYAAVDPATAWWNGEDFESYEALTDMKEGWGNDGGSPAVVIQTTGGGTNKVLGMTFNGAAGFGESSQGGGRGVFKSFDNALSGKVYVKTTFYHCTNGTRYILENSNGEVVFVFGGINNTSNNALFYSLTADAADYVQLGLGGRGAWSDVEFVLDLDNNKLVSFVASYQGSTSAVISDIDLNNAGDIKTLRVKMDRGYEAAGLDNATFGELIADAVRDLSGPNSIQALSGVTATGNYSVVGTTTAMEQELLVSGSIHWSISNYGTLSVEDQAKVVVTPDVLDARNAILSVGEISADATITLTAEIGESSVTYNVELKAASEEGAKQALADEIAGTTTLMNSVSSASLYVTGLKTSLASEIATAQSIYDDDLSTAEQFAQAVTDLKTAQTVFNAGMVPVNNFVAYVQTVQDVIDAQTRTEAFFVTIEATLSAAITAANTSLDGISTTEEIAAIQTALQEALEAFNADITAFEAFETQISTVQTRYDAAFARVGTQFLAYNDSDLSTLSNAISAANTATTTVGTSEDLQQSVTDLSNALAAFEAAGRVAPDETKLYTLYSYGVSTGDGDGIKKEIYVNAEGAVVWAAQGEAAIVNSEWVIKETTTGKYTLYNYSLNAYLANSTAALQSDPYEFSIEENVSQAKIIERDGFFLYSLAVVPAGNVLEVREDGNLRFAGRAERYRYLFQFEPVRDMPSVGIESEEVANEKVKISSEYFDLTGKAVPAGTKGFVIKKTVYVDGSVSNEKLFIK